MKKPLYFNSLGLKREGKTALIDGSGRSSPHLEVDFPHLEVNFPHLEVDSPHLEVRARTLEAAPLLGCSNLSTPSNRF